MVKINEYLTTISVTYNNSVELSRTLESLSNVVWQPKEIIIIDGGSTDGSVAIIESYIQRLPQMRFISEKDAGIFDAMNKGKRQVKTKLIHYLTAGDYLYGEPYMDVDKPSLLPVGFIDESGQECGVDRVKLLGTGYNHQGMIVSVDHEEYDVSLWVGADYKMSLQEFPKGLSEKLFIKNGGVKYQLGGLSSDRNFLGTYHLVIGIFQVRPLLALPITFILILKSIVPRPLRRCLLRLL